MRFSATRRAFPSYRSALFDVFDVLFNVFSKKVLTGYTIFTSPTGDKAAILRVHPSYAKVQSFAGQMQYLHFSVILLKTLSIGPAPGIEPRTSRSYTVKCQLCRPS